MHANVRPDLKDTVSGAPGCGKPAAGADFAWSGSTPDFELPASHQNHQSDHCTHRPAIRLLRLQSTNCFVSVESDDLLCMLSQEGLHGVECDDERVQESCQVLADVLLVPKQGLADQADRHLRPGQHLPPAEG